MTRVAIYSRFSSDLQRAASIDDQRSVCQQHAARNGWTVVADYSDAAISGATLMRPGIQSLMKAAAQNQFDVVLSEALDRFSRDQEDIARLAKHLKFARVKLQTVSEGEITPLHIGLRGTMNALYLDDLADKTRRGLRGRVEAGRSGGGRNYGHGIVLSANAGERGKREIVPAEAEIVRWIFEQFAAGRSPKSICKELNARGVAGPRGSAWSPSTLHGHSGRKTGILNNETYVGRLVWNRQRFEKNPVTGKRVARLNQRSEWVTTEVPELRIIDDALWAAVKVRQSATRAKMQTGLVGARAPKHLFSGLLYCGACGSRFILSYRDTLTCFNATSRATCTNRRKIKRQDVEGRVLHAVQTLFFARGAFEEFCRGYVEEMEAQRKHQVERAALAKREFATVKRRQSEILKALSEGYRSEAWKGELLELDARAASLEAALNQPHAPALHPKMAAVYREKVSELCRGLGSDEHRESARASVRGLIERILIPPGDQLLRVEGNLPAMLDTAHGRVVRSGGGAADIVGCGGGI